MNCGRIYEFDYFEMRLSLSSTISASGSGTAISTASNYCQSRSTSNPDELADWIVLFLEERTAVGWTAEVHVYPLGLTWSSSSSGDLNVRVYGDLYSFSDHWELRNPIIKVYQSSVLVQTWTLSDISTETDTQLRPTSMPIIGIPGVVGGTAAANCPASGTSSASSSITATGGWRWVIGGTGVSFPTTLDVLALPSNPCGAADLVTLTCSDTWTAQIVASASLSVSSPPAPPVPDRQHTSAGVIVPVPNFARSIERIGTDYRGFWLRTATPSATAYSNVYCPAGTTSDSEERVPARDELLAVVGQSAHAIEDVLNDSVGCLYSKQTVTTDPTFLYTTESYLDGAGYPTGIGNPILSSSNARARYWDYLVNPHWNYFLWFEDWDVDGSATDLILYWNPIRQQWLYNSALDISEQLYTRNNIVLDACKGSWLWHELYISHNLRQIGASRFDVENVTPLTSYTYDSGDSALFTYEDCAAALGSDIVLTATGGATSIAYELDLAEFNSASELWNFLADQYQFDWITTNISAIRHYFVGSDGNENLLTFTKGVWTDRARAESTRYAGSWAIDNGNGIVFNTGSDILASGQSASTMADGELVHGFELAPGSTWAKLRVEVDLVATGSCTLNYPKFRVNGVTDPSLVTESAQSCAFLYADQSGFRYGNAKWTDPITGSLQSEPYSVGMASQMSIVDGLAWRNVQLLGQAKDTGLSTDITSLFDSVEGDTVEDVAFDTHAVILPSPTRTRFQLALINNYKEFPPLALMPRKARDSDWAETGSYCLESWSWIPEPQRYVTPGTDEIEVYTPGDVLITSVEAGYPAGWAVSKHSQALDNTETGYKVKIAGEDFARIRPWQGHFGVFGLRSETGSGISADVGPSLRHVRAYISGTDTWAGTGWNASTPVTFADSAVLSGGEWLSIRYNRSSNGQQVWLARESSGSVILYRSSDGSKTFSVVGIIASGTKPSLCSTKTGQVLIYYRDGAGALKVQQRNPLASVAVATTTAIASVDDQGVAIYCFESSQGHRFACLYISGGNLYRAESEDGITFGAGTLIENTCKKPSAFCDPSGTVIEVWISGTKIRGERRSSVSGVISGPSDFVASGVDDAQIAVTLAPTGANSFRGVLLYSSAGAIIQANSFDLIAWT